MAELRIQWADGRSEIRALLPGQITTVGDSRLPVVAEEIPIGKTLAIGGKRIPFCRVRLHGDEIPAMVLLTADSTQDLALPSARKARRAWGR